MAYNRPPFDDETWKEIEKVRARLEAYRDKCQPYPAEALTFERELQASIATIGPPEWTQRQQYQVDQLRAQVLHLQSKVERLLTPKKRKGDRA